MESSGSKDFEGGRGRTRLLAGMTAVTMTVGLALLPVAGAQAGQSPKGPNTSHGDSQKGDHKKPVVSKHREKNPKLPKKCGLDVAIVIDRSGSIATVPGALGNVKSALTGLVDSFVGSGSNVSLISFATTATTLVDSQDIDTQADANRFDDAIDDLVAAGGTNWQAALQEVQDLSTTPDLVLFLTDGRPNTTTRPDGTTTQAADYIRPPIDFSQTALDAAVDEADAVKEDSTLFAVAFGQADDAADFGRTSIRSITGDRELSDGGSIRDSDFVTLAGFAALRSALLDLASGLCSSIDKDSNPDGKVTRGSKISYSVTLKNIGRRSVTDSLVDQLPAGVRYVRGSADERGPARFAEPRVTTRRDGGQTLTWRAFELERGERQVYTYKVTVNRNVDRGDKLTNTATWNGLEDSTTNVVKSWSKPSKDDDHGKKDDHSKGHDSKSSAKK